MVTIENKTRAEKIAKLNDEFRKSLAGGRIVVTSGIAALGHHMQVAALRAVQKFEAFTEKNDPYCEHDFGFVTICRHELFWKIDYYDPTLSQHTDDATDSSSTVRVLTIMLKGEY
jgi:hypothetical protein